MQSLQAAATEKRCLSIQESIKEEAKETLACLQSVCGGSAGGKQAAQKPSAVASPRDGMTPTNSVSRYDETPLAPAQEVLTSSNAQPPMEKTVDRSDSTASIAAGGTSNSSLKSILLDDPKSLHNTEEEVKDVLMNLASLSPSRNAPILSRGASRSLPHFSQSPAGTPEVTPSQTTNIVLEYKFGRPTGSVA